MSFSSTLLKVRSSLLFLPIFYGIISLFLAILSLEFDSFLSGNKALFYIIPSIFFTDIDLAHTVLSTISASLLTMTTITFSSIMIVLTTYLSQFSPRTLQNFISDQSTQRVLGIFVGGFVYSTILLLFLHRSNSIVLFFSPTLAVLFAIICVIVFVFFLNHVSSWIQVSNLIHNITSNTIESILEDYDDIHNIKEDAPWEDWESDELSHSLFLKVYAPQSGYLKLIDIEGLIKKAKEDDSIIKVEIKPGDYIDQDTHLLSIWNLANEGNWRDYLAFISIGPEKAPLQDIEFGTIKLVEIALRALSPAINDPNTAINCIYQLGKILAKLGKKHLPKSHHNDQNRNLRLIIEKPTFEDYLYKSFYQIRHYGSSDVSVLVAIIDSLQYIAENTDNKIKDIVWRFSKYIIEDIEQRKFLTLDRQYVDKHLTTLIKTTGHTK